LIPTAANESHGLARLAFVAEDMDGG
jgi:hypothetical protein